MHFCQNTTNYKLQKIEKRKLNTNEQKTQLASTKKKMSMKNLSKTGESYVNRNLANVWGKKFKTTQGKRRIFRRSEEHTSELQSRQYLVCRLLLENKKISLLSCY